MNDSARSYDVQGLHLDVEAETASLFDCTQVVLKPFDAPSTSEKAYRICIGFGDAPREQDNPCGLRRLWSGELPDGIRLVSYRGENLQRTDLLDLGSMEIHWADRLVKITVARGSQWCIPRGCLVPVLCQLLARAGQHVVHSASLQAERNGQRQAILIAGSRNMGKTTTSLAMGHAGMKLMGDDVCFITRDNGDQLGELAVWGLLLDCKVDQRTLEILPWLERFDRQPARTPDEYIVDARQALGVNQPVRLRPGAIFVLEQRNEREHRITPLDAFEAISLLTRENIRASDPDSYPRASEAFGMLGELVRCTQTYRLSVGPEIESLYDVINSVLRW